MNDLTIGEETLTDLAATLHNAEIAVDRARDARDRAIRDAYHTGMSMYRAAKITGLSQPQIKRIVSAGPEFIREGSTLISDLDASSEFWLYQESIDWISDRDYTVRKHSPKRCTFLRTQGIGQVVILDPDGVEQTITDERVMPF